MESLLLAIKKYTDWCIVIIACGKKKAYLDVVSHSVHSELFPQARESINFWEFTVTYMSTYLGQYKSKVYRKSFHSWWFSKSLEVKSKTKSY